MLPSHLNAMIEASIEMLEATEGLNQQSVALFAEDIKCESVFNKTLCHRCSNAQVAIDVHYPDKTMTWREVYSVSFHCQKTMEKFTIYRLYIPAGEGLVEQNDSLPGTYVNRAFCPHLEKVS